MSVPPDAQLKADIDGFVGRLKVGPLHGSNNWAKFDFLHIYGLHTEQAGCLNAVNPGTFDATKVGSPTFTAQRGYRGNGTDGGLDYNFTPSTSSVKATLNSTAYGVYCITSGQEANTIPIMGKSISGTSLAFLLTRTTGNSLTGRVNTSGTGTFSNIVADGSGLTVLSRTASNLTTSYQRGVAGPTPSAGASTSMDSAKVDTLKTGGTVFSTKAVFLDFWGSGMTANEVDDFNSAVETFRLARGVPTPKIYATWGDSMLARPDTTNYVPAKLLALYTIDDYVFPGGVSGDTSAQVRTRFEAGANVYKGYTSIFWCGRNNASPTSSVITDISAMIAALTDPTKYIVILNCRTTTDMAAGPGDTTYDQQTALRAALLSAYGAKSLDVESIVLAHNTDGQHPDSTGAALIAAAIKAQLDSFGW